MKLKQILLIGAVSLILGRADSACAREFATYVGWNFFQDPVSLAVGLIAREWNRHTETIHYDVAGGIRQIKENIGSFQSEGICGVSATGNSGCDLTTEEEGAEMTAKAEKEATALDETTIKIIEQSEADGKIGIEDESVDKIIGNKKGDLFNKVRNNVRGYIFKTNDVGVNADCTCNKGTGKQCSQSECALARQNDALFQASTAASATADTYLRDMDKRYQEITTAVQNINKTEKISDFVGKMGILSIIGSSWVADLILLQAYDLRAQSYRNLVAGGVTETDLSKLKKEATK